MMRGRGSARLASLGAILLLPVAAQARDTEVFVPAQSATQSDHARDYLLDVPFYLKGEPGAPTGESRLRVTTRQSTRGVFRSDEASCRVAFLTAVRELQKEARRVEGDAVIDIVSVTGDVRTESATDFRCLAGAIIVRVALEGKVVDLD